MRQLATLVPLGSLLLLSALPGCTDQEFAPATDDSETSQDPLIYGTDNRQEYYQISDALKQGLADSTVALVSNADIRASGSGYSVNVSTSLGSAYGLCSSEPYRTQPTVAFCSGFMVGDDLIATAGHCVSTSTCADTHFVFGFHMNDSVTVRAQVPASDVYRCNQVVGRAYTSTDDYSVVRVDRPIVGHRPLQLRRSGTIALGAPLIVAGHPAGIPLKVAGGATVRSNGQINYFSANLDTYGGNSGSPVVDASTLQVEGILVRGNNDWTYLKTSRCYVSNVCNDTGCPGWEDVTRTARFVAFVPQVVQCTNDADCDDSNVCNGAESCVGSTCIAGQNLVCNDGNACTADSCVPATGCHYPALTCNDGDACTVDACDPLTGCTATPVQCDAGEYCSGGLCFAGPACGATNAVCYSNAECCSGSCRLNRNRCR